MRISELITLEIENNSVWTDYSDGVIDIGIIRGIQGYEAIWQTPEAGVLTIVTRNPNIDPYVNSDVRMGRQIRIKTNGDILFTGRITDINVDYQPKGKPQISTITAVDMIGQMGLHALSDGFTEQLGSSMDTFAMFQELQGEIIGWNNPVRLGSGLWAGNASGVTASGTNALSVAKILAQTQIEFFYADKDNDMYLYPRMNYKKDDDIKLQFDSRGGATSYREIELTDNFEVLTNQLSIRNQGYNSNIIPLYTNSYSVSQWGQAKKDFRVQITGLGAVQQSITDDIKDVIFEDSVHPSREIYSITWDGSLNPTAAADIDILDNVYVYHEVDPTDISRKYGVIGIEHRISDDDWEVKYYLKNHFIYDTNFPVPVITSDHPLGATINDDVTLSISNASDIDLTSATYAWKYAAGTTGNTPGTTFSTVASPVLNYALANIGIKYITCTVTDSYGFVKTSAPYVLEVFGAAPTAVTTSYTINPADTAIYTFTATTTEATSYTFHWGDGTTFTTTQNNATHRYDTEGPYDVYVVATNPYGSTQSATTSIDVEFLPFPTAEIGTFPIRYVALVSNQVNLPGPGTVNPVYGILQLNTSNAPSGSPTTDPQVNRALIGDYEDIVNKAPGSTATPGIMQIANPQKINIQSGQSSLGDWTYFYMPTSGSFHNSIIFDMSAPFYDIKDVRITFKNISSTITSSGHTFDIWITDNVEETVDFDTFINSPNWWKIGSITSGSIAPNGSVQKSLVPLSYITMPLNYQPFPVFTYTVGNTSENIQGDKYTFATDDFLTSSYLWNFGDGNTSTLQNPVHTYASSGTRTVTLTKYDQFGNPFSTSQTVVVNRLADQIGTFPVRYVKLKQNTFNATALRYSPLLGDFTGKTSATGIDRFFNKSIISVPLKTNLDFWDERDSSSDQLIPDMTASTFLSTINGYTVYPRNSLTIGYSQTASWSASGAEPRATAVGNTAFELVWDLGTPRYDIDIIGLRGNRAGGITSTATKPTYEVYFSSDNVNWTKVANVSFGTMSNTGVNGWYAASVSPTVSLPLNI